MTTVAKRLTKGKIIFRKRANSRYIIVYMIKKYSSGRTQEVDITTT